MIDFDMKYFRLKNHAFLKCFVNSLHDSLIIVKPTHFIEKDIK